MNVTSAVRFDHVPPWFTAAHALYEPPGMGLVLDWTVPPGVTASEFDPGKSTSAPVVGLSPRPAGRDATRRPPAEYHR